ncbi:MAG: hypothetical protein LQ348_006665 [Seirophora lacunosa]|nr:MAG: hypothetical protein LQ348_006665 [Seirophora lacunosa]
MNPEYLPTQISHSDFTTLLASYPSLVPSDLEPLDQLRYTEIPSTLAERKASRPPYLSKTELQTLVKWKLKHGTHRPSLPALIASNPAPLVQSTTAAAFTAYSSTSPSPSVAKATAKLCELKGVGPATASLLLCVYDPENVPFFSDELFRWLHWEEEDAGGAQEDKKGRAKGKTGEGWARKIKYTAKEYGSLVEKTGSLRERLGSEVKAVDVERVAWALRRRDEEVMLTGKQAGDKGEEKGGERGEGSKRKASREDEPVPKRRHKTRSQLDGEIP